jgi:hypothetical protein
LKLEPTIDIAAVRQWLEVFCSLGVDRAALLVVLHREESVILERDSRIAQHRHDDMLRFGSQSCGIPGIALLAGVKTTPDNLGIVGHLMMNCETLLAAGRQIVRFSSLLCESIEWSVTSHADRYDIHYRQNPTVDYSIIGAEASLASCIGMLRFLSNKEIIPLEVIFSHAEPDYSEVYDQVFGRSVKFNGGECLISISAADAELSIPHQQPYVLELLSKHAQKLFSKLDEDGRLTLQVRQLVCKNLADGYADIEHISSQLAMSRWTLTRKLKQEGTTFNDLVRQIRCELSRQYLRWHPGWYSLFISPASSNPRCR